jgi:hypothetical protein
MSDEVKAYLKEVIDMMNSPKVVHNYKLKELEGIVDGVEKGFLFCKKGDGGVDFKDLTPSIADENSLVLDHEKFRGFCPDGILMFGHTHGVGLSENSKEDRFSMQDLLFSESSDFLCAGGIDGISCHIGKTIPPTVIRRKWDEDFYLALGKMAEKEPMDMDSVMCDINEPSWFAKTFRGKERMFDCVYNHWQDGFDDQPLGSFKSVIVIGGDHEDAVYNGGHFKLVYGDLKCLNIEPLLVCYTKRDK